MEKEILIAKGVKCVFNGQATVFEVESLNENFDGLQYHESDVIEFEGGKYLKVGDVNFTVALRKEVKPVEEIDVIHEDLSETKLEDAPEEDPNVDFDVTKLKEQLDSNEIKIEQLLNSDTPDGIAIDLDSVLEGDKEELKITPEDPEFGTEGIVYNKSIEEADAEIKSDNENIKPEYITDANDVHAETIEKVVEEVKKEDDPIEETVAEEQSKKSTKKK